MNSETIVNRIICSPVTKITALVIGFFTAVSFLRAVSVSYRYYLEINISGWPAIPAWVLIPIFAVCVSLFFISVLKSRHISESSGFRRIDWSLLAVLIFFLVFFCVSLVRDGRFFFLSIQLLLFSAVVYFTVMLFLGEIAARIRDGQLKSTLYWIKFFRMYPVTKLTGFLMAAILAWDLLVILYICFVYYIDLWVAMAPLSLAVFTLAVLSYICSFLLSISDEYAKANEEKIRAERFKAELITNVSHDIRTPLTAIINYVDLLKGLPLENPEFTEYIGVLDKKTLRLKTLIDDLMEASKAGTGNLSVELNEIDLIEITGQVAGEFDELFTERELTLVFRQPDDPVLVMGDRRHMWRALENLFGNAAKYALPGTRVFAEIGVNEGGTVFSLKNVSQNPIDLPPGALTEQFIRGDLARQTEGSGLGLYISKSLIELMGGSLSVSASGDLFEIEIKFGAPSTHL